MSKKKDSKEIIDFIFSPEDSELPDIEKDLIAKGIDVKGVQLNIQNMIKKAKNEQKRAWMSEAKEGALEFKNKVRRTIRNPQALLDKLVAGDFGIDVREHALQFNRNKKNEDMSEDDIRAFLEACDELGLLPKDLDE